MMDTMAAVDFFTVATATFSILYVFVVLSHDRTHYSLEENTPFHRPVEPKPLGHAQLAGLPRLGGLHHRYERRQAA